MCGCDQTIRPIFKKWGAKIVSGQNRLNRKKWRLFYTCEEQLIVFENLPHHTKAGKNYIILIFIVFFVYL